MQNISLFLSLLCSLGATVGLSLAIYFFIKNRAKQGWPFVFLLFLCVVLAYVPQLDSIRGGFLDAKFNRTLNDANEIIGRLTRMAVTNARVSYTSLAWGNRLMMPYAKDKQAILDDVDRQLAELGVSVSERKLLSRTFVNLVGVDLSNIFLATMEEVVQEKVKQAGEKTTKQPSPEAQKIYEKAIADSAKWRRDLNQNYLIENFRMSEHLLIPKSLLDHREEDIARKFANKLMAAFIESEKKGGYSDEAAALVDGFSNQENSGAKHARDLFGPTFLSDNKEQP